MGVAAARSLPIVYQIQDWWALCARANLVRPGPIACPGPTPLHCSQCLPLTGLPPTILLNSLLYIPRNRVL